MSENALYPVFELYNYKRSGCGGSNLPYTHILKLNLDDLQSPNQINLNYSTIYDRFALKDFGDYLYVCTSFGNNGFTVTAYDSQLNEKGSIEKIAAGEDIKSVTYQEADNCRYCYITTYRNTDPLFKVDITNPEDMNLLGSLSITGYSTYMLTLSDSYMVSIGYDGDNRSADNSVLKVSLYGVSNGNLTLIDYMTVSGILNCEALTNSKAIAVSKENLMFGFSVLKEGSIYSQGYYVFNIKDGGLNDLAYITNNVNGFDSLYFDNFRTFIRRAFVYNGYAYFISDSQICSYSIALFSENKDAFVNSVSTVIE